VGGRRGEGGGRGEGGRVGGEGEGAIFAGPFAALRSSRLLE